ncbi:MAG: hypothetical protein LAP38_03120 [Acidobacteriia bacterium]|nr:hypothetical protein [Terriglobia bacterium]
MSAAATAIRVETPAYFEAPNLEPAAKEAIGELVHELRQPLSSIEAIAYFLEMTLPAEQLQARHYMRRLQQLVGSAELILERTVSTVRKPPASASNVGSA